MLNPSRARESLVGPPLSSLLYFLYLLISYLLSCKPTPYRKDEVLRVCQEWVELASADSRPRLQDLKDRIAQQIAML